MIIKIPTRRFPVVSDHNSHFLVFVPNNVHDFRRPSPPNRNNCFVLVFLFFIFARDHVCIGLAVNPLTSPSVEHVGLQCTILLPANTSQPAPIFPSVNQQPASQPADQPISRSANQPVSQSVCQSVSQPASQPVSQPVSQPRQPS